MEPWPGFSQGCCGTVSLRRDRRSFSSTTDAYLVFGQVYQDQVPDVSLEELPGLRFLGDDIFEPIRFRGVGDIDSDGFGDLILRDYLYSAGGVRNEGLVLLVYGAPNFPAVVQTSQLAQQGIRVTRFLPPSQENHQLGGRVAASSMRVLRSSLE